MKTLTRRPIYKHLPTAAPACEEWVAPTTGMTHAGGGNFTVEASQLGVSPARFAQCSPKQITVYNPKTGGRRVYTSKGRAWVFTSSDGGEVAVIND